MSPTNNNYRNISLTQLLERLKKPVAPWFMKRLSGNDTGVTGGHQAGLYVPKSFMKVAVPSIVTTAKMNPTQAITCYVASHDHQQNDVRAKYYNNRFFPERGLSKKYDEFRMTRWIGSPLVQQENTGSIVLFAAIPNESNEIAFVCWVAKNLDEENLIERWLGCDVDPGQTYSSDTSISRRSTLKIPDVWGERFPTGSEIFDYIKTVLPQTKWCRSIDELLLKRRKLEFRIFTELEHRSVLPRIESQFESVDSFVTYANSIVNRRKARSGLSLELNLDAIFTHERLRFDRQAITEQKKKPDFLFPSKADYDDLSFPSCKLHMLAAKTCCKDRWRQVINEADRISPKHLFTLQEGVSENQLDEMKGHGIRLVIPEPNLRLFPKSRQNEIQTLQLFVNAIRKSQAGR